MLHRTVITFVLAIFLAVASLPLAAQMENQQSRPENVPDLLVKANTAYAEKDYLAFSKALERLRVLRPNNGGSAGGYAHGQYGGVFVRQNPGAVE